VASMKQMVESVKPKQPKPSMSMTQGAKPSTPNARPA
jgi:hypothetical protein